jgi:hypothetical protein
MSASVAFRLIALYGGALQRLPQLLPILRLRHREVLDDVHDRPAFRRRSIAQLRWRQPPEFGGEPPLRHVKVCEQALAIAVAQRLGAGGTGGDDDQDHESEQCSHGGDPTSLDGCRDLECDEMPLRDAGRRMRATSDVLHLRRFLLQRCS